MAEWEAEGQAGAYAVVAHAIRHVREHRLVQPGLDEVAAAVGLSPHHLQRVFKAWAGVSPKRFLQCLTLEDARRRLAQRQDVLSVTHEVGLSSPGRLHALTVGCEAMTPGEMQSGGQGLSIAFGEGPTPFGPALIAWTARGICHLAFLGEDRESWDGKEGSWEDQRTALRTLWPHATWTRDAAGAVRALKSVFMQQASAPAPVRLLLRGTNFQVQVWKALLAVAPGEVVSYQALAARIGRPRAARAVGTAVAANTIACLIPCHRVIRESGEFGQYRWGPVRKAALLAREACAADSGD